jgi:hypothetical protein
MLVLSVILFTSCSNDSQNEDRVTQIDIEEFTASSISSARLEQKLKYKQKHLKNWDLGF